nr:MAG TPA: hypothetical protein [Caudoviricetes sp.]
MIFDEFAENYFGRLGELRGSLDCLHDNRYDDYDKSVPEIFVETYKAAYRRGYDAEHMASRF